MGRVREAIRRHRVKLLADAVDGGVDVRHDPGTQAAWLLQVGAATAPKLSAQGALGVLMINAGHTGEFAYVA
jgi:hypothetical protein